MNIENIILLACLLVVIQIFVPIVIEYILKRKMDLSDLFSSRDKSIETSIYYNRGKRALSNLLETFPIFIFLVLLSIFREIDNSNLAILWLTFRLIYVPTYILGIDYARTLLWIGSMICLILMGIQFI